MTHDSYEPLDDLFKNIRLALVKVMESDPTTAEDLKNLVAQLELWVDSLVADSLKLKRLHSLLQKTAELAEKLREKLEKGTEVSKQDSTAKDKVH